MKPITDDDLMREAIKEACKAYDCGEVPVGTVIVCNNKIISRAHNQVEQLRDCTAHAEMIAITSAFIALNNKYLNHCIMYTTLEPCVMCAGAIYWSHMSRLVFAARDLKNGYSLINGNILHPTTKISSGILEQESSDILKRFFSKLRLRKTENG
jgi:tRNA(adenine34) deaminase